MDYIDLNLTFLVVTFSIPAVVDITLGAEVASVCRADWVVDITQGVAAWVVNMFAVVSRHVSVAG